MNYIKEKTKFNIIFISICLIQFFDVFQIYNPHKFAMNDARIFTIHDFMVQNTKELTGNVGSSAWTKQINDNINRTLQDTHFYVYEHFLVNSNIISYLKTFESSLDELPEPMPKTFVSSFLSEFFSNGNLNLFVGSENADTGNKSCDYIVYDPEPNSGYPRPHTMIEVKGGNGQYESYAKHFEQLKTSYLTTDHGKNPCLAIVAKETKIMAFANAKPDSVNGLIGLIYNTENDLVEHLTQTNYAFSFAKAYDWQEKNIRNLYQKN